MIFRQTMLPGSTRQKAGGRGSARHVLACAALAMGAACATPEAGDTSEPFQDSVKDDAYIEQPDAMAGQSASMEPATQDDSAFDDDLFSVGMRKDVTEIEVETDAAIGGNGPAMWRLADDDSEIYLFGTFHVLPSDVQWTTTAYLAAMADAETTIVEADATSPEAAASILAAVQEYGVNPPGVTLTSILGSERARDLRAFATRVNVPMQVLEPLRPWLALVSLTQVVFKENGFEAGAGVEAAVLAQASDEGDTVDYLETAEEQIKALASLDSTEAIANFDTSIDQLKEFEVLTAAMLDAWKSGDVETLEEMVIAEIRAASPSAYKTIFTDRNAHWTARIEEIIAGEGNYFIAVGAGHLVGVDSVVAMLERAGYAVDRVQ